MSKAAPSSDGVVVSFFGNYQNWAPSQAWLAEMVRAVASRLFAQAISERTEVEEKSIAAVHRLALASQVLKLFGALFNANDPRFIISSMIDLLFKIGDLAELPNGYCVPRESRVVRITNGWGRIAGGLPLELSEHVEDGLAPIPCESIGRIVNINPAALSLNQGTEHSEIYLRMNQREDSWFADLCAWLPKRHVSPPAPEATSYYNAGFSRVDGRGNRWQKKIPSATFVVARTGNLPTHYSIFVRKGDQREAKWFDITHEEARKWVLLAERMAGTMNRIKSERHGSRFTLFLPDMLPSAWTDAILASASVIIKEERGWRLEIEHAAKDFAEIVFRSANIEIL